MVTDSLILTELAGLAQKGGAGSGHHDHAGRPGERGGSAPSGVHNPEETAISADRTPAIENPAPERDVVGDLRRAGDQFALGNADIYDYADAVERLVAEGKSVNAAMNPQLAGILYRYAKEQGVMPVWADLLGADNADNYPNLIGENANPALAYSTPLLGIVARDHDLSFEDKMRFFMRVNEGGQVQPRARGKTDPFFHMTYASLGSGDGISPNLATLTEMMADPNVNGDLLRQFADSALSDYVSIIAPRGGLLDEIENWANENLNDSGGAFVEIARAREDAASASRYNSDDSEGDDSDSDDYDSDSDDYDSDIDAKEASEMLLADAAASAFYGSDFDYNLTDGDNGYAKVEIMTKDKGDYAGFLDITVDPDESDVHLDYFSIPNEFMNQGIAEDLLRGIAERAKADGLRQVSLLADISIGKYAWAKYGFDVGSYNPVNVERMIWGWAERKGLLNDGGANKTAIERAVRETRTMRDLAALDVNDIRLKAGRGGDPATISNYDVPKDMQMHIGKAFLLDDDGGYGSWDGYVAPDDLLKILDEIEAAKSKKKTTRKKKATKAFMAAWRDVVKGGDGSGNHGHRGRVGKRGGSMPRNAGTATSAAKEPQIENPAPEEEADDTALQPPLFPGFDARPANRRSTGRIRSDTHTWQRKPITVKTMHMKEKEATLAASMSLDKSLSGDRYNGFATTNKRMVQIVYEEGLGAGVIDHGKVVKIGDERGRGNMITTATGYTVDGFDPAHSYGRRKVENTYTPEEWAQTVREYKKEKLATTAARQALRGATITNDFGDIANVQVQSGFVRQEIENAMADIAAVHGIDQRIHDFPVVDEYDSGDWKGMRLGGAALMYPEDPYRRDGIRYMIVNEAGHSHMATFVHEMGHVIDFTALGVSRMGEPFEMEQPARAAAAIDKFKRVSLESKSIQPILKEATRTRAFPAGAYKTEHEKFAEYLADPCEIWARAYAQYIAVKSGRGKDRDYYSIFSNAPSQISAVQRGKGVWATQWDDDDFEPIAEAIEGVLDAFGWLNENPTSKSLPSIKGGQGSGNHGHRGRIGKRGGSMPRNAGAASAAKEPKIEKPVRSGKYDQWHNLLRRAMDRGDMNVAQAVNAVRNHLHGVHGKEGWAEFSKEIGSGWKEIAQHIKPDDDKLREVYIRVLLEGKKNGGDPDFFNVRGFAKATGIDAADGNFVGMLSLLDSKDPDTKTIAKELVEYLRDEVRQATTNLRARTLMGYAAGVRSNFSSGDPALYDTLTPWIEEMYQTLPEGEIAEATGKAADRLMAGKIEFPEFADYINMALYDYGDLSDLPIPVQEKINGAVFAHAERVGKRVLWSELLGTNTSVFTNAFSEQGRKNMARFPHLLGTKPQNRGWTANYTRRMISDQMRVFGWDRERVQYAADLLTETHANSSDGASLRLTAVDPFGYMNMDDNRFWNGISHAQSHMTNPAIQGLVEDYMTQRFNLIENNALRMPEVRKMDEWARQYMPASSPIRDRLAQEIIKESGKDNGALGVYLKAVGDKELAKKYNVHTTGGRSSYDGSLTGKINLTSKYDASDVGKLEVLRPASDMSDLHLSLFTVDPAHQRDGVAEMMLRGLAENAESQGITHFTLLADITVGKYAWAKYGFDIEDYAGRLPRTQEKLDRWLANKGITGDTHKQVMDALGKTKSMQQLAALDVGGIRIRGDQIGNGAVPVGMEMHIGKAFLLDSYGFSDWNGMITVKDLLKTLKKIEAGKSASKAFAGAWRDAVKGGAGSGNAGHAGRPGKRGGSLPRGARAAAATSAAKEPAIENPAPVVPVTSDIASLFRYGNNITDPKTHDEVDQAMRVIGSVHNVTAKIQGDGIVGAHRPGVVGSFQPVGSIAAFDNSAGIEINEGTEWARGGFVHEFGHMLDYTALGINTLPSKYDDTNQSPEAKAAIEKWKDAISESATVKAYWGAVRTRTGAMELVYKGQRFLMGKQLHEYLMQPNELWARSYEQYIASKSQDPEILKHIDKNLISKSTGGRMQWDWDDFAPIEKAIDDLFAVNGWAKSSASKAMKGGRGSGNWGHEGRIGQVGGSAPDGVANGLTHLSERIGSGVAGASAEMVSSLNAAAPKRTPAPDFAPDLAPPARKPYAAMTPSLAPPARTPAPALAPSLAPPASAGGQLVDALAGLDAAATSAPVAANEQLVSELAGVGATATAAPKKINPVRATALRTSGGRRSGGGGGGRGGKKGEKEPEPTTEELAAQDAALRALEQEYIDNAVMQIQAIGGTKEEQIAKIKHYLMNPGVPHLTGLLNNETYTGVYNRLIGEDGELRARKTFSFVDAWRTVVKGGAGSGHWGHQGGEGGEGNPGGSQPSGAAKPEETAISADRTPASATTTAQRVGRQLFDYLELARDYNSGRGVTQEQADDARHAAAILLRETRDRMGITTDEMERLLWDDMPQAGFGNWLYDMMTSNEWGRGDVATGATERIAPVAAAARAAREEKNLQFSAALQLKMDELLAKGAEGDNDFAMYLGDVRKYFKGEGDMAQWDAVATKYAPYYREIIERNNGGNRAQQLNQIGMFYLGKQYADDPDFFNVANFAEVTGITPELDDFKSMLDVEVTHNNPVAKQVGMEVLEYYRDEASRATTNRQVRDILINATDLRHRLRIDRTLRGDREMFDSATAILNQIDAFKPQGDTVTSATNAAQQLMKGEIEFEEFAQSVDAALGDTHTLSDLEARGKVATAMQEYAKQQGKRVLWSELLGVDPNADPDSQPIEEYERVEKYPHIFKQATFAWQDIYTREILQQQMRDLPTLDAKIDFARDFAKEQGWDGDLAGMPVDPFSQEIVIGDGFYEAMDTTVDYFAESSAIEETVAGKLMSRAEYFADDADEIEKLKEWAGSNINADSDVHSSLEDMLNAAQSEGVGEEASDDLISMLEEVGKKHFPSDYSISVDGQYDADYEKATADISIIDDDGNYAGHLEISRRTYDGDMDDDIHLELFEVPNSQQHKGIAERMLRGLVEDAEDQGVYQFSLLADITIGRYAWAKYGFDIEDYEGNLPDIVYRVRMWASRHGIAEDGDARMDKIVAAVEATQSMQDLAAVDIPRVVIKGSEIGNYDVPSEMKMHLGKAFLLAGDGYGDWDGTISTEALRATLDKIEAGKKKPRRRKAAAAPEPEPAKAWRGLPQQVRANLVGAKLSKLV